MTIITSVYNQAGGVGKTTLVQNVSYHLVELGYRVLAIDLDPQSTLSAFMGIDRAELKKTVYHSLMQDEPLPIIKSAFGFDFAPANLGLQNAESELVTADMKEMRLKDALEPVLKDYDLILIDCPPQLGNLTYISLVASTHILVPIATQFKAFDSTELLMATYKRARARANRSLKFAAFVPTMYDGRNLADTRVYKALAEQLSELAPVLDPIPRSVAFVDASEKRQPLAVYQPRHPAIVPLKKIAKRLAELCPTMNQSPN